MMHSSPLRLAALLAATLSVAASLTAAPARAQDETRKAQERACSRDVSRHCRKVMNDGDMVVRQCLMDNHDKLSPACRKIVEGH